MCNESTISEARLKAIVSLVTYHTASFEVTKHICVDPPVQLALEPVICSEHEFEARCT